MNRTGIAILAMAFSGFTFTCCSSGSTSGKHPGWCETIYDGDMDGTADGRCVPTYDDKNRVQGVECDNDANGMTDYSCVYTYKDNTTVIECDENNDGTVDSVSTLLRDDEGNILESELDSDADGSADEKTIFTYDEDGNIVTMEYDDGANGMIDSWCDHTYEEDGKIEIRQCGGSHGFVDWRCTERQGEEKTTVVECDYQMDESIDSRMTYDEEGNLLSVEYDIDGDGTFDNITTYLYDCW